MLFYFHILIHFTLVLYHMPSSTLDFLLLFIQLSLYIDWDFSLCMTTSSPERWVKFHSYVVVQKCTCPFCKMVETWDISLVLLQQVSEFDLFTLDDIDSAFQTVTRLTYSQNHHLSGRHLNVLCLSCCMCFVSLFYLYNLFPTPISETLLMLIIKYTPFHFWDSIIHVHGWICVYDRVKWVCIFLLFYLINLVFVMLQVL